MPDNQNAEDRVAVYMKYHADSIIESNGIFKLLPGEKCSWTESDKAFGWNILRPRIEPWLNVLTQSEHLSLLVGSGLTHAVQKMATGEVVQGMSTKNKFDIFGNEISNEVKRVAKSAQRENGNLEDQIRVANEYSVV